MIICHEFTHHLLAWGAQGDSALGAGCISSLSSPLSGDGEWLRPRCFPVLQCSMMFTQSNLGPEIHQDCGHCQHCISWSGDSPIWQDFNEHRIQVLCDIWNSSCFVPNSTVTPYKVAQFSSAGRLGCMKILPTLRKRSLVFDVFILAPRMREVNLTVDRWDYL